MDDNCHVERLEKTASAEERQKVDQALLAVWGMGCPNCANRVRNSLLSLNGVLDASVDHRAGMAQVSFNPTMVSPEALVSAVSRAGGDGRHEYGAQVLTQV